ncbi:MAG: hypothetical protein ACYCX4_14565, partial [Bacillota bacterium]
MIKIKDKVWLGALSGIIVTSSLNVVDWISVLLKTNKWHIWQIAASTYFELKDINTFPALFIGAVSHTSLMALAGVTTCYLLYFTGRDYYLIKGLGVLMMFWLFIFGAALRFNVARIHPVDIGTNISHYIGHASAGLLISFLIVKLA